MKTKPRKIGDFEIVKLGRSGLLRIPEKYRLNCEYVRMRYRAGELILSEYKPEALEKFLAMPKFPDFSIPRASLENE